MSDDDDYQNLERQIVQEFSTSLKALVQDAINLRQIASLYRVYSDSSSPKRQEIQCQLNHMDQMITALEQNVSTLTLKIKEEEDHIQVMKRLHVAAMKQNQVIEQVIQGCESVCISFPTNHDNVDRKHISRDTYPQHEKQRQMIQTTTTSSNFTNTTTKSQNQLHSTHDDDHHNRFASSIITQPIHLHPISEKELESVSKNIRGRLPLIVLNEALEEIIRLTQQKYDILTHRGWGYTQVYALHHELQVQENEDTPWISEQELRKSCSFFRGGESTARSILLVLRTLKRLKQVYSKGHQVTYVCL